MVPRDLLRSILSPALAGSGAGSLI